MLDTIIHKFLRFPYLLNIHIDQRPKRARTTILLLHGIGNSGAAWDEIVRDLPDDIRIISVDLLGFGESPSPRWMKYDITIQAHSVVATLLRLNIRQPLIVVGHSMGALTAVEIAKRYPFVVKSLVLCSPPFYSDEERRQLLPNPNKVLRDFYRFALKAPATLLTVAPLAVKLKIVGKAFNVTRDNVDIYMAALESSIIHQTSLQDAMKIKKPMQILYGAFDPVVIKKNLEDIIATNTKAELTVVLAGHELLRSYIPAAVKVIKRAIN